MNHRKQILAWLRSGKPITHREADRQLGCARLAARIYDLRQEGFPIITERYTTPHGAVVAKYRMKT